MGALYSGALRDGRRLEAVYPDGTRVAVPVESWRGPLLPGDSTLLDRCTGATLDVGCGPGRLAAALRRKGVPAVGIDVNEDALRLARAAGARVHRCSVFGNVPWPGRWDTVLLADGNIGIGGDPLALLRRCRAVLRPGAVALVETSPDRGHDIRTTVTLHGPGGRRSHPVPWAVLGSAAVVDLAASAGFVAVEEWRVGGRAFVMLRHAG